MVNAMINNKDNDFSQSDTSNYLKKISDKEYRESIERAIAQANAGQTISQEDFEKEMEITDSIMTPEELRNELLEGIKDSKEGRFISVEDLIIESKNW